MNNKAYKVQNAAGNLVCNNSTGTRIYTRKSNALRLATRFNKNVVVEYELVPTGNVYDCEGELVDAIS